MEESLTFTQFKTWLTSLIRNKGGELPNLEDWKQIKQMMDRVVPEKELVFGSEIDRDCCPSPSIFPLKNPQKPPPFTQLEPDLGLGNGRGAYGGTYGVEVSVGQEAAAEWAAKHWGVERVLDYGCEKKIK